MGGRVAERNIACDYDSAPHRTYNRPPYVIHLQRRSRQEGVRRRRRGVAPLAVKAVWQTADSLLNKGIGATVRNSIEDLAGWAQVERPDLARLTADGDVVIAFSDIES